MNNEIWTAVYAAVMAIPESHDERALASLAEARANEAVLRFERVGKKAAEPAERYETLPPIPTQPDVGVDYLEPRKSPSVAPRHAHR
jgi:hypothetical protein